ncbi:hypothetical protein NKS28_27655 [Bacillus sp. 1663tsa1]|uniref:hypothetical protein n=1 Tax=Bacillus sp. 1663tsa1 TaxID=2953804 RepID=UPI00209C9709|nr:hypothetical protein [Bacillus sp. 1663tsa1]MCP1181189.1 hypothetical protein [Bacillus sp. 1663tsa1]
MSKLKAKTYIIEYQIEDHTEVATHKIKAFTDKNITKSLEDEVERRFKKKCNIISINEAKTVDLK